MLVRRGTLYELYPHKVEYTQHGDTIEQWALPSKEWWIEFEGKWEHTTIVNFTEVELTEEQLSRYEEIKDMPEDFTDYYIDYILSGVFPDIETLPNNHPLEVLKIQKENQELKVQTTLLKAQNQALTDTTDFHEEVLAEIILTIHS